MLALVSLIGFVTIAPLSQAFRYGTIAVAVVVAIAIVVAIEQSWFALRLSAHVAGLLWLAGSAGQARSTASQVLVLVGVLLVAASLVPTPSLGDMSSSGQRIEVQLAVVNAPWAIGVIDVAFDIERGRSIGALAVVAAAVTSGIAVMLRRQLHAAHVVAPLLSASIALSIAISVSLSTRPTYLGLAVQGAGLMVLMRVFGGSVRILINAAVLLGFCAVAVLGQMMAAWDDGGVWLSNDLLHLAMIVVIGFGVWESRSAVPRRLGAAGILVLVLVWLGSVLEQAPQGQAWISASWAVLGTALLLFGLLRKVRDLGGTGLVVLAVTVGKLLTVDLREVDALWRAALFLAVGLGLMRLGFLLPRLTGDPDPGPAPESDADAELAEF